MIVGLELDEDDEESSGEDTDVFDNAMEELTNNMRQNLSLKGAKRQQEFKENVNILNM